MLSGWRRGRAGRGDRAADFARRAIQRLMPVVKIRKAIGVGAEVAGGDIMIAGGRDEKSRSQERPARCRRRLFGIENRPVLGAILRDEPFAIHDIAGNHHEIRLG